MSEVYGTPPQFCKAESTIRIKEVGIADQPKCECSEAHQKKQHSGINIQGYTLISELIFYVHFNQNKPVTSMKMEKHSLALLPRENPLNFNLKIISRRMWLQKHRTKGPNPQTSTYFPGSGICVQSRRSDWKLLRMEWMFAIPMNTTSQLG